MELLIIGCAGFLLTHLGISGSPLRNSLRGAMSEQANRVDDWIEGA